MHFSDHEVINVSRLEEIGIVEAMAPPDFRERSTHPVRWYCTTQSCSRHEKNHVTLLCTLIAEMNSIVHFEGRQLLGKAALFHVRLYVVH